MAKKRTNKKAKKQASAPRERTDAELREALSDEMDDIRAVGALNQLQARGGPRLSALLVDLASNSDDIDLRATAAQALGDAATAKHRSALLGVVDDPEPEVARRAAESLGRIGGEVELKKLRSVRAKNPVVKRAVETAKTLLSYRTGSTRGRLALPQPEEMLELGKARSRPVVIAPVDAEVLAGEAEQLKRLLPQLPRAPVAYAIECGRAQYLLVLHKDLKRGKLDALGKGSAVMGALLRRTQIDGTLYLDGYLLSHPGAGKAVQLFLMRSSGELSHQGQLIPKEKTARFSLSAVNTRHSKPVVLEGTLAPATLEITLERGQVATERSVVQPTAKRPRRITAPAS